LAAHLWLFSAHRLFSLLCLFRQEAGETYEKCANIIATKLSDEHSVGIQWENAAKAYKNVNSAAALAAYSNAVAILMDNNKFAMAAKIWKEMGAINEKEHNTAEAIKTYEKAANW
jgi:tetratricopeptide (TPR) repeat protein